MDVVTILRALCDYYRLNRDKIPPRIKKIKTPLHFAALHDLPEFCNELIDLGFHVNQQDEVGNTPLHYAFTNIQPNTHVQVIDILYRRGASNVIINRDHCAPTAMSPLDNYIHINEKTLMAFLTERGSPDKVDGLSTKGGIEETKINEEYVDELLKKRLEEDETIKQFAHLGAEIVLHLDEKEKAEAEEESARLNRLRNQSHLLLWWKTVSIVRSYSSDAYQSLGETLNLAYRKTKGLAGTLPEVVPVSLKQLL